MTEDKNTELKKHADRLSGIATQLVSLLKNFNKEYRALRKDAKTKWQDKRNPIDYVLEELLAPVDSVLTDNGANLHSLLSDAAEICRIESGYGPTTNPVEDIFEASEETAHRQEERYQRQCEANRQIAEDARKNFEFRLM